MSCKEGLNHAPTQLDGSAPQISPQVPLVDPGRYYFDLADLLTLGILALIVAAGEHWWATRHNLGMELRT